MPGPATTLLIEGSFSELAEELAKYLDALDKSAGIEADISPTLAIVREQEQAEEPSNPQTVQKEKDDVLKKLVSKASILNGAPEKEFNAAYNLLITLSNQSPIRDGLFAKLCQYLSQQPITSTAFGPSLAISTLTTIFNTVPLASAARYHVFIAILTVIKSTKSTESFKPLSSQLESNIPLWLSAWKLDEEHARTLYETIADVAEATSYPDICYQYLLKALETIDPDSASEPETRDLAKRTLIAALTNPSVTDFTAITSSDAIQALRSSDNKLFELLELFSSDDYESYATYIASTPLSSLSIPENATEIMSTKMRQLTLASMAATSPTRSVAYSDIVKSLQIPPEDVEMWVIDTIRAGLVEGKLSQLRQELLVQRATYRLFGEKQWAEIQGRLMVWRRSLEGVLAVVKTEKERYLKEGAGGGYADEGDRDRDRDRDGGRGPRMNGYGGERRPYQGGRRQHREPREPREEYVGGE